MAEATSPPAHMLVSLELNQMLLDSTQMLKDFQVRSVIREPNADDLSQFHNSGDEKSPLLGTSSKEELARMAKERALQGMWHQQQAFVKSPLYNTFSTGVINSEPRKKSLFIRNPITIKQHKLEKVSKLHKLLDPCCDKSTCFKSTTTTIISALTGGIGAGYTFVAISAFFSPPLSDCAITGYLIGGAAGATLVGTASVALIVGCSIYHVGKVLKKLPVTGVDLLLSRLNKQISKSDSIDLQSASFPRELISINRTASLRDPVFISDSLVPISAREFLQCLSTKGVLPNGKECSSDELVITELSGNQNKKIEHLKKAFELWDAKKATELTDYINEIPNEERFW